MSITEITPEKARELIAEGALLVDIRDPDEHARAQIPGARNIPLSQLSKDALGDAPAVVFHCRSGNRTASCAPQLRDHADCPAYIVEGGIEAWRKAGLPVREDRSQPLEIMRQVQIAAGLLILTGVLLGFLVGPGFFGLSAFVGAGLMFAGITGWCGMARLLMVMPWNRRAAAA